MCGRLSPSLDPSHVPQSSTTKKAESPPGLTWLSCLTPIRPLCLPACEEYRSVPYERHPQVIHGMKGCKLSLFIPPLAGQWPEPPHLVWVHRGLGGEPNTERERERENSGQIPTVGWDNDCGCLLGRMLSLLTWGEGGLGGARSPDRCSLAAGVTAGFGGSGRTQRPVFGRAGRGWGSRTSPRTCCHDTVPPGSGNGSMFSLRRRSDSLNAPRWPGVHAFPVRVETWRKGVYALKMCQITV